MTPERKAELMREAAETLKARWGEVRPDAVHALAEELRVRIAEQGPHSTMQAAAQAARSAGLFSPATETATIDQAASRPDPQQDLDYDR